MSHICCRVHIVQEFNKGVYDYIIATDEASGSAEQDSENEDDLKEGDQSHIDQDECGLLMYY